MLHDSEGCKYGKVFYQRPWITHIQEQSPRMMKLRTSSPLFRASNCAFCQKNDLGCGWYSIDSTPRAEHDWTFIHWMTGVMVSFVAY